MRPEDILGSCNIGPFERGGNYLRDGMTYDIEHSDMLRVGRSRVLVFAPVPEQQYDAIALRDIVLLSQTGCLTTRAALTTERLTSTARPCGRRGLPLPRASRASRINHG